MKMLLFIQTQIISEVILTEEPAVMKSDVSIPERFCTIVNSVC